MFVGSVRTRDRYSKPVAAEAGSENQDEPRYTQVSDKTIVPFALSSFDIRAMSKANFIRCSTASVKSVSRDCTSSGNTRKLWAVCKDEARSERF